MFSVFPQRLRVHQRFQQMLPILLLVCASGCAWHQPTLPIAFRAAQTLDGRTLPPQRDYWTAFRTPSKFNATGLYLLEPYQPGRIPLVMIHGLASDALTWDEMITALRSDPNLAARYQIWVYQYPTGNSYLKAAADLRKELQLTRSILDPDSSDQAFDQMVLVGHSMGGIIARLLVSYSDDRLWHAVSDKPLSEVFESGPLPDEIVSAFLFEPVPFVRKVVYFATPQHGSNWSEMPLGRFGRWLIDVPQQLQDEYVALIQGNPGLIRNPASQPATSIDHLSPRHRIMQATSQLRGSDLVSGHSIIGIGFLLPDAHWGDGVVAIPSARIPCVQTEYFVTATHSGILRNRAATAELMCILMR